MSPAAQMQRPETDSVLKPAMLLMSGRSLAFLATFFIPVVLARFFDQDQFGTYKQLFLIESTIYFIAQFGIATSLYYFLPREPRLSGRYVANSMLVLLIAAFGGLMILAAGARQFANLLQNAQLTPHLPWMGLYLFLRMLSAGLEIVQVARGQYLWASASYALSDVTRAAALVAPVLFFGNLRALLIGAVAVAACRVVATLWYFVHEFRNSLRFDLELLKSQLAYAIPFGLAVLVEIVQTTLPQYVVSHRTDPATFAIFAVGCLQIPLVDFAASPTSDVMMVKMQKRLAENRRDAVISIWNDTTRKLGLLFFPLVALLLVSARDIFLLLFTERYAASVPIFMAWSLLVLFATLQVDGVLRVLAQTRMILILNLVRLGMLVALIQVSLSRFDLLGPVVVMLAATAVFKVGALVRMRALLGMQLRELLPWRELAGVLSASAASGLAAFALRQQLDARPLIALPATAATFGVSYLALVWLFDLVREEEKRLVTMWCRRKTGSLIQVFDLRKA